MQLNKAMINPAALWEYFEENKHTFMFSFGEKGTYNCSGSFLKNTGYTFEEINAMPFKHFSLTANATGENFYNRIKELFDKKENSSSEFIYAVQTKNDETIWLKEIAKLIRTEEKEKIVVSIAVDISEVKNKEEQLEKVVREKSGLNRAKDKLISIISHDLRAPFTSLLGFAEILLNEPDLPLAERTEYIEFIYEASKIQLEMVNHLLDWTHLQNGTMKFNPQRLNIADIASNCISVLTGVSIRKNIEIKLEGLKDIFVTADERLITQVITNLLSNALKFTPSGKRITVSIGEYKSDMAEVVVKDEGIGISEENQTKMFNIDTKFSLSGTAGEKGSGLGLTLVKEIVEKHSGEIWFYSKENEGSEFHFTLPRAEDLILIIEKDEAKKNEYKENISELLPNYKILFAQNGFEALSLLNEKKPSAVIGYHKMSLMSGVQLVATLREKDTHKNIPVIIIADELSSELKDKYSEFGKTFFIAASSTVEELTTKLLEFLI